MTIISFDTFLFSLSNYLFSLSFILCKYNFNFVQLNCLFPFVNIDSSRSTLKCKSHCLYLREMAYGDLGALYSALRQLQQEVNQTMISKCFGKQSVCLDFSGVRAKHTVGTSWHTRKFRNLHCTYNATRILNKILLDDSIKAFKGILTPFCNVNII